jgi:hypothetical protein
LSDRIRNWPFAFDALAMIIHSFRCALERVRSTAAACTHVRTLWDAGNTLRPETCRNVDPVRPVCLLLLINNLRQARALSPIITLTRENRERVYQRERSRAD